MKKRKLFLLSLLLVVPILLSACSNATSTNTLPSAKTVLSNAVNTKLTSLQATWVQTDKNQQVLQKSVVDFQKDPFIIHINAQTNSNSYKMWMNKSTSYIQDQGTSSKRWFKTKANQNSSFKELTAALNSSTLMTFSSVAAKFFKVQKTATGYKLTYDGKDQKMWNQVITNTILTTIVGIDQNSVKPEQMHLRIFTNKNYKLKKIDISTKYVDSGQSKNLKLVINQINQLPEMQIPSNVTKSAVDLADN